MNIVYLTAGQAVHLDNANIRIGTTGSVTDTRVEWDTKLPKGPAINFDSLDPNVYQFQNGIKAMDGPDGYLCAKVGTTMLPSVPGTKNPLKVSDVFFDSVVGKLFVDLDSTNYEPEYHADANQIELDVSEDAVIISLIFPDGLSIPDPDVVNEILDFSNRLQVDKEALLKVSFDLSRLIDKDVNNEFNEHNGLKPKAKVKHALLKAQLLALVAEIDALTYVDE